MQQSIDAAEAELRRITDAVRRNCRVLGTTVAKAVPSRPLLQRTDVVVIDEAGMVDLPSAWYVGGLAGKRVVVAGDFRQLPAITKAVEDRAATPDDRAHARRWSATDAFRAAGLVSPAGTVLQQPRLVALNTQYRMRPSICALVNAVAYPDALLTTGRVVLARPDYAPSALTVVSVRTAHLAWAAVSRRHIVRRLVRLSGHRFDELVQLVRIIHWWPTCRRPAQ